MIIWRLSNPLDHSYASAARRGTWTKTGVQPQTRTQPLIIEWEPGSDVVGDFVWAGFDSDVVIVEEVANALSAEFTGFELGAVKIIQDDLTASSDTKSSSKRRVLLSYKESRLFELWVTKWVPLDSSRSSVNQTGDNQYEVNGIERYEMVWDASKGEMNYMHVEREMGKGLYIYNGSLSNDCFFKIKEFPSWVFCTDGVKLFIEKMGYSNVRFIQMGETFSSI